MNKTKIDWVKNPDRTPGYTWNPITGCLNGCEYCYAKKLANGRLKHRYLTGGLLAPPYQDGIHHYPGSEIVKEAFHDPFYPRFWEDRLLELNFWSRGRRHLKNNRGIFVCDMSDLFGIGIPEGWTKQIMEMIRCNPFHRFYLLTKQPQNLIKFSPFPDNCWVGVTATNEDMFTEALWRLSQIKAKVKYISIEPFLKRIPQYVGGLKNCSIDWLIIGAQTKPYKPPEIEWVEEIVKAADKAGIPVFLKDNLKSPMLAYYHLTSDWGWREARLRQEMPG